MSSPCRETGAGVCRSCPGGARRPLRSKGQAAISTAAARLVDMTNFPGEADPESLRALAAEADALFDRLSDAAKVLLAHATPVQAFRLGETAGQFGQAVRALTETARDLER